MTRDPAQPLRDPTAYVRHERQAAAARINRWLGAWQVQRLPISAIFAPLRLPRTRMFDAG